MAPNQDEFRRVMAQFATGVTIVTTRLGDELHGMTANAVASLSLEPPLVLVCVDKGADTHDILARSGFFAVNILSLAQEEISVHFARKETEGAHRLDAVPHRPGLTGSPIIEGCLAYLECRVIDRIPAGDHTIFVGGVEDARTLSQEGPLIFFRGQYTQLA